VDQQHPAWADTSVKESMERQPGIAGKGQSNVYCSVLTHHSGYCSPVIAFKAMVLDVVKDKRTTMDQLQGSGGRQASIHTSPQGLTQGQAKSGPYHLSAGTGGRGTVDFLEA
jgi:hypothetical protein